MKQVGKLKAYSLDEIIDQQIGPIGSEKRDQFEEELKLEILAHKIKSLRKEKGLSQTQLGVLIGKGKSQISKIESGSQNLTISTMLKVLKALNAKIKFRIEIDDDSIEVA
ncbi:XRE family transcriptional regulator [Puteibacter caeruleilacunae]|nr:XRE family transcriptional regulator [Puteibacter caeruleilacunae]